MAGLYWDKLSVKLQQNVLLRLHWDDLCRCCAVCKEWNHVIKQPGFMFLHASTLRPESCVLTAPRKVMTISDIDPTVELDVESDLWQLLEIPTNRVFSIPDTFIRYLREALLRFAGRVHFHKYTIAASGGLIYARYRAETNFSLSSCNIVYSLLIKRFHHYIPDPPPGRSLLVTTTMVVEVDGTTLRYRIIQPRGFWNARSRTASGPWDFVLYDSRAKEWITLCDAPSVTHFPCSCVVLNGIFYAMFDNRRTRRHELYSCDLESGRKCHLIDVSFPRPPLRPQVIKSRTQVVAASGSLFFVGYSGPAARAVGAGITVTIWRITLGERPKLTLEAQLPSFKADLRLFRKCLVQAIGCGDSIVVSTFEGRRVRWDLVRRTWYRSLPPFLPRTDDAACNSFFVGSTDHV